MNTWAVETGWHYEAVEVVRETDKMVFYMASWRNGRETRKAKTSFLPWRGSEDDARAIAAKLTSATAEYDRRRAAASDWFKQRRAEILSAYEVSA